MFYQDKLLKMNLQMFSDPDSETTSESKDKSSDSTQPKPEQKYTDEDVEKISATRVNR